jgi:hypothetical protein
MFTMEATDKVFRNLHVNNSVMYDPKQLRVLDYWHKPSNVGVLCVFVSSA